MVGYTIDSNPRKSVRVYGRGLKISNKSSVILCSAITGKNLEKGKALLLNLLAEKQSINGKYFTKTTKEIALMLKNAESNAEFKGLDTGKLVIRASAHKGFRFWRARGTKNRGTRRKATNIQVILEER